MTVGNRIADAGGTVRLLDPHVVNQIAAGEVVERPAACVKELLENALDAGATQISIDLVDSGRTLIRVADNGCGMSLEDATAALQRHATSKISLAEDLLAVRSLGFRGEALPSIASVSRLTLATARQDGARTVLSAEGGTVRTESGGSGPSGTTVSVEELFYNTPARLKFLKSDTSELGVCLDVVGRLAVAYPDVAIRLSHNGQLGFETTGDGDSLDALANVWSRDIARSLAEVDIEVAGIHVTGFVSPPHVTKPTRAYQFLCVNGRPVRTRTLTAAIDQAYRDLTPERRHAILSLNLEIDPDRIDVNVSPTKSEVKFQHEGAAFEAIRAAVRGALMEHGMMPQLGAVAAANTALEMAGTPSAPIFDWPNFEAGASVTQQMGAVPVSTASFDPNPISLPPVSSERFPFGDLVDGLRVIGQAMLTFIDAETLRGLIIMDQHVAHERILYEYLCGLKGPSAIEAQPLLVPQTITLDRRAVVLLRERLDEIRRLGFELEPFGGESFVLRTAPAALRGKDPVKVLHDLVDELVESTVTRRLVPTREQIWITTSCKLAVKAGDPLSHAEMERLIVDLASTENPYLCPHGRPITVTLDGGALLRLFKRTLSMIILGIDPGLERIGFGVIQKVGSRLTPVEFGLIHTPRILLPDRLKLIYDQITAIIDRCKPDAVATERLLFTANKTTAMDVAKALGSVLLAVGTAGVSWAEYSPPEVKLSVVGNGAADKKQVTYMVRRLLSLTEDPKPDDVADALAIAITHAMRAQTSALSGQLSPKR